MQRLIFGVDVTDLSSKLNVANRSLFSKNYVNEQNLLAFYFDLFKWGQYIPNNPEVNNQRFSRFKINFLYSGEVLEKNELQGIKTETIELLNQTYYASEKEDIAYNLMKTMKGLESMKSSVTETHPTVVELKSLMNLRLASEKTIGTFSLSTFENLISSINLLAGEYIKTKNKPGLFLLKSLATPWDMFDKAISLYKKESKISDEEFAKMKQSPISNMLAEINKIIQRKNSMVKASDQAPDLTIDIFYTSNFDSRLNAIVEKLSQMNAVYKTDQKDFDAQFSLIMSTLIH